MISVALQAPAPAPGADYLTPSIAHAQENTTLNIYVCEFDLLLFT